VVYHRSIFRAEDHHGRTGTTMAQQLNTIMEQKTVRVQVEQEALGDPAE